MNGPLVAVLLAAALPEVLKRCKPLAKIVGDTLERTGKFVHQMAGTEEDAVAPNPDVKEQTADQTTKVGKGTEEVDLETASPTGHDEVSAQIAAEAKGDGAATEPVDPAPRKEKKPLEPDQPRNPRRQKNSRPD
jgi:hypothetical protein